MKLNRLVSTTDLSYEDWLKYRKQGIGGSDAGALCGLNPYKSPMAVYIDKTEIMTDHPDNEAMRQGRDLEQYVAERFMEATGKKVRRANAIFYNEENPFMLANVDRLIVGENAGLECKTASAFSADKWKDGKIPESYEIQCHHYMAVTGADAWYIACVVLGREFIYQRIERDEELIQMLIKVESDFWNDRVATHTLPEPDGSKASEEIINKYYDKETKGKSIELYGFDDSLKRRAEIIDLTSKLSKEKDEIEQQIKMYMEDAEKAESENYTATWKKVTSNRVDSKKLKADYPEIYTACCRQSSYRRFEIKAV